MKRIYINIIVVLALMLYSSCEKQEKVDAPSLSVEFLSEGTFYAGDAVTFVIKTEADNLVVWPGKPGDPDKPTDAGNDYYTREKQRNSYDGEEKNLIRNFASGYVVNDTIYTYTYDASGVYKAVFIATNVGDFGNDIQTTQKDVVVTVEDRPE